MGDRLDDDEEGFAEELNLGALVGLDRVLDGELVQVELTRDRRELLGRGFDHAEPDEASVSPAGLARLLEAEAAGAAFPLFIDGAVDDHSAQYRHRTGLTG